MTLTQKSVKSSQSPLVQSYAAVANAESYELRKCREDGNYKCAEKYRGCSKFLWMADMVARDALTNTGFTLAKQLLHFTEGGASDGPSSTSETREGQCQQRYSPP